MDLLTKVIEKALAHAEVVTISGILMAFAWRFLFLQRKLHLALPMLGLGLFALGYLGGILAWLSGLGGDSFLESSNFEISEAFFWGSTFLSSLSQMLMPFNNTTVLIVVESFALSATMFFIVKWQPLVLRGLLAILVAGIAYSIYLGYKDFESGRAYVAALEQQFNNTPGGFEAKADIDLFVYIGESTTSMNMSLYGYPLPTTPQLDRLSQEDEGFLRFDGVKSTHTHTSPSLLRALAFTSPQASGQPVQWGIGSVLKQSGLKSKLHSVQPVNGSFAAFSKFVFDGVDFNRPREDQFKGNYVAPRMKDHELLEQALTGKGIVFFHSYAGHGHYLDLIETSLSQSVKRPNINFDGMYGSFLSETIYSELPSETKHYDQAITYIDRNVARAIEVTKHKNKPAALIYFADHGEAAYARRGHESSTFIHEMSMIPLILYFNEAYRKAYPEIYLTYRKAAESKKTRLLDQISPTILDILRIQSSAPIDVPTLASDAKHPRPYILDRDTITGPSRINIEYDENAGFSKAQFIGGTPEPTYISIINEKFADENTICYHRANSYAKALRGAAATNCLEFDLMVDSDALNVYHPPATSTGFQIEHIFSIAQARKNSLWIDSKNLDDPAACNKLASYLELNHKRVGQIFVEFPAGASSRLGELQTCGHRLQSFGARSSYYVPTHLLLPCAENPGTNASACKELDEHVQNAMASGIFTDLSFDFLGYPAMKRIQGADKFKWNTWGIKAQEFHRFPREDFKFVILDTSTDPNSY